MGVPAQEWEFAALAQLPAGAAGTVEEVAKAVVFLALNDSIYINGIELLLDSRMA